MKPSLVLFDFDGTITFKDTFLEFIKFYKGSAQFYGGMLVLSPILVLFKLKLLRNWQAKESVLTYFFKDENQEDFQRKCDEFALMHIPSLIRPKAFKKLEEHRAAGDLVIIVSASAENWIAAWANKYSIPLIATKLEMKNARLTGKISGSNCYGIEKVNRLKAFLQGASYDKIFAYGDSRGDKELLNYATDRFYRYF